MAIDAATFVIVYPEFAGESSTRIDYFLTEAQKRTILNTPKDWGDSYEYAVFTFTAHILAMAGVTGGTGGGSVGQLTKLVITDEISRREVNVANTSTDLSDIPSEYRSTPYGVSFYGLYIETIGRLPVAVYGD